MCLLIPGAAPWCLAKTSPTAGARPATGTFKAAVDCAWFVEDGKDGEALKEMRRGRGRDAKWDRDMLLALLEWRGWW